MDWAKATAKKNEKDLISFLIDATYNRDYTVCYSISESTR